MNGQIAATRYESLDAILKKLEADGTWAKLWTVSIGQRTGSTAVPTPPAIP